MTIRNRRGGRRARRRATSLGAALVLLKGRPVGRYVVQHLSAAGAQLLGSRALRLDRRVRVFLQFPDHDPCAVDARVVHVARQGTGEVALTVSFRHRTDETEDLLQQEALTALVRARHPAVLLVSDRRRVRRKLARELEGMGRSVRVAAAPLDALRWLEDPDDDIDTVIVMQSLEGGGAWALLQFFAEEYPELRRVMIADGGRPARDDWAAEVVDRGEEQRRRLEEIILA